MTNLIALCDQCVDKGWVVDAVDLDFSRDFNTVSHSVLIFKSMRYGPDKWKDERINQWCKVLLADGKQW